MLSTVSKASQSTHGFAGAYLEIPANPTNLQLTPIDPPGGC
ncbi:MAG: hypothetical protein AB1429_06965 [Pseudomonadota bacterium]|jgi:hypothetical protein